MARGRGGGGGARGRRRSGAGRAPAGQEEKVPETADEEVEGSDPEFIDELGRGVDEAMSQAAAGEAGDDWDPDEEADGSDEDPNGDGDAAGDLNGGGDEGAGGPVVLVCMICMRKSSEPGLRWFELVTFETSLQTFVTEPRGKLCFECGCVCEARPADSPDTLAELYKTDADFRRWFLDCKKVLNGGMQRDWRPQWVHKDISVGMRCKIILRFVSDENVTKYYKTRSIDMSQLSVGSKATVVDPEGQVVTGLLLKPGEMPDGLPYFEVELYSTSDIVLRDTFLSPSDSLFEGHASNTQAWLKNDEFQRRNMRLTAAAQALTWKDFDVKVAEAQAALQEKERAMLRQLELADQGRAPATSGQTVVSGSRLRRPAEQPDPSGPAKRKTMGFGVGTPPAKRATGAGRQPGGAGGKAAGGASARGAAASRASIPGTGASTIGGRTGAGTAGASAASMTGAVAAVDPGDGEQPLPGGVDNPELAKLLVSRHGKPFPSVDEILAGVAIKRELSGVEDRLQILRKEKRFSDVTLLEEHLAVVYAAQTWSKPVSETDVATLSSTYATLVQAGTNVPHSKLVACSLKIAQDCLGIGNFADWCTCISPHVPDGAEWSPALASFALLVTDEASAIEAVMTSWSKAVVNDQLISLVVDAGPAKSSTDEPLQKLCSCLSAALDAIKPGSVGKPWSESSAFLETVKVLRGLAALASPVPGFCGASFDDVNFLIPIGKRKKADEESYLDTSAAVPCGKGLYRWLTRPTESGPNPWKKRHELYVARMAAEEVHRLPLTALTQSFKGMLTDTNGFDPESFQSAEQKQKLGAALSKYIAEVEAWRKDLRPEATSVLDQIVYSLLEGMGRHAMDQVNLGNDADAAIKTLDTVAAALQCVPAGVSPARDNLAQEVSEVIASFQESGFALALGQALEAFEAPGAASYEKLEAVNVAFKASRTNNTTAVCEQLAGVWPNAFRLVCKNVVVGADASAGLQFLLAALDEKEVKGILGQAAKKDVELVHTLADTRASLATAFEELGATVRGGDASGSTALESCLSALESVAALKSSSVAFSSKAAQECSDVLDKVFEAFSEIHTANKDLLVGACQAKLKAQLEKVGAHSSLLRLVAKGDTQGRHWYHKFDPKVTKTDAAFMTWLKDVASKVDAQKIEQKLTQSVQVRAGLSVQLVRFREHCGEHFDEKLPAEMTDLSEHIVTARLTKLEVVVARTLCKDSLSKARREKLLGEQLGSFLKDLKDWGITTIDPVPAMWPRLCKAAGFKELST